MLEGTRTAILVFNPSKNNKIDFQNEKIISKITEFDKFWLGHPNSDIDLAFIPLAPILDKLAEDKKYPFLSFFRKENFPTTEEWNNVSALEQIVIVGYPSGIWDPVNNLPVVRRGVAASHPKINYRGSPEFLIDAAVYHGSSGSPVFFYNYKDLMLGQDLNLGKDKPRLAGILSEIYGYQQNGEMKSVPIPTVKKKKMPFTEIPNNLGIVIKSTELDGFIPIIDSNLSRRNSIQIKNINRYAIRLGVIEIIINIGQSSLKTALAMFDKTRMKRSCL